MDLITYNTTYWFPLLYFTVSQVLLQCVRMFAELKKEK